VGTPDATPSRRTFDYKIVLLLLSVAAAVAYVYYDRIHRPNLALRLTLHDQIIQGAALSPYRYRVLVPFTAEILTGVLSAPLSRDRAFLVAYAICDLTATWCVLLALFVWLREWFTKERSLVGVLFVAATMSIALQDHYFQPWSLTEAALFGAALIAIRGRRFWILACLVAVASLNRETAVFIPLAFLATSVDLMSVFTTRKPELKPMVLFVGLLAVWLVIFGALRYFRGHAPPVETIGGLLNANLAPERLARAVLSGSLFLGFFWVFAVLGFRSAPRFVRRLAVIIPPYVIAIGLWGMWYEVRLLMPLYFILVPLGLSFLYDDTVSGQAQQLRGSPTRR